MNRRFLFCMLIVLLGLLAACGQEDDDPTPPPNLVITYEPQPEATILPGCVAGELESWLEVSGTLIYTFRDEAVAAVELAPGEMTTTLNRLIDLRDTIARQPTPECAIQPQSEILIVIRGILADFQRYSNGDTNQDELRASINAAAERINSQVTILLETATTDLEARLDEGQ